MKRLILPILLLISIYVRSQNVIAIDDYKLIADHDFIVELQPTQNDSNMCFTCVDTVYGANHGVVTLQANLVVRYTLMDTGYFGIDTLTYVAHGINNIKDTGLIIISIKKYYPYAAHDQLDGNNVNARINTDGSLFWDSKGGGAQFEIPNGSNNHTIFTGHLNFGGINQNTGVIHLAGGLFDMSGRDFWPGPICLNYNYYNEEFDDKWNRVWSITADEIEHFKQNWPFNSYVVPEAILNWPAHGESNKGQSHNLAPFYDNNYNGIYEPQKGDYPIIKGDKAVYFIFNDDRNIHTETGGKKIKMEVHGMAYAYNCAQFDQLNNTIFIDYSFINRSANTYADTYVGLFMDLDIGGYNDDFVGCDVMRNTFYGYNGDTQDEDAGGAAGYGSNPPAQGITFLKGVQQDDDGIDNYIGFQQDQSVNGFGYADGIIDNERRGMESFISFNRDAPSCCNDPKTAYDYYNFLQATWGDNSHVTFGGNGHSLNDTAIPAKFMFPGNTDPDHYGTKAIDSGYEWTEISSGNSPSDRRGIGSTGPFTFKPNDVQEITIAFVTGFGTDNVNSLEVMQDNIDKLTNAFQNKHLSCDKLLAVENKMKEVQKISIYPNPANNVVSIEYQNMKTIAIYNQIGMKLKTIPTIYNKVSLDLSNFANGLYFIEIINNNGNIRTEKLEILK